MHRDTYPVPERVRLRAEQSGPQSSQWLNDLPSLIAELEQEWALSIGQPFSGGSSAYVAPVKTARGNVVIKIAMPIQHRASSFHQEADTLLRADGHGYVRVLKVDYERRALLLERLGPSIQDMQLTPQQTIKSLCQTLQQAWLVRPGMYQTLQASEYKAQPLALLISELWDELGRPCPENIIAQALEFAHRRMAAFDPQRCVLVHGDPHPANALQALTPRAGTESGYVFVDPEGFLCEPAYDLGVVMRAWNEELLASPNPLALAREYCQLLAMETNIDEASIWQWGFIEHVSSGLYIYAYGSKELGQPFFTTAQRLLDT